MPLFHFHLLQDKIKEQNLSKVYKSPRKIVKTLLSENANTIAIFANFLL